MMKKNILLQIKNALKNSRRIIILCHIDPDGDTIGSALALRLTLEKLKKKVTVYSQDGVPKVYKFLPGTETIVDELDPGSLPYDCAITVDASEPGRLGDKVDLAKLAKFIINIDHHPDNTNYGQLNYVGNTSSVGELIYHLCRALHTKCDKNIADCLYTAIITDTGNFRYENTTETTFKIAAELLRAGVKTHEISTRIYDNRSITSVKVAAAAMSRLQFSPDHRICWSTLPEKVMADIGARGAEAVTGIVDHLRSIEGVEIAILFREDKGKIKINFRSKKQLNVGEVAREFGGGGHAKAAGAVIEGEMETVTKQVVAAADKYLKAAGYLVR